MHNALDKVPAIMIDHCSVTHCFTRMGPNALCMCNPYSLSALHGHWVAGFMSLSRLATALLAFLEISLRSEIVLEVQLQSFYYPTIP
jgi:hypothetical protein